MVGRYLRKLNSKGVKGLWEYAACRTFPLRERLLEAYLEWRLGIETRGEIAPEDLGHRSPCVNGYMPTFYASNLAILGKLRVSPERDVFIDFGSGKGRVIALAARYPFKRVIGIEFSSELNEIARRNIERARGVLRCRDVELVSVDAREYQIPDEATVLYLANPFYGDVLDAVLNAIRASLIRSPRPITVISHSHSPAQPFEEQMRSCPWLELRSEVKLQCWTGAWIYANCRWKSGEDGSGGAHART